ncbi:RtcB family protein [soil metagenome]
MAGLKLKGKDLRKLGFKEGKAIGVAMQVMEKHFNHLSRSKALDILSEVLSAPDRYKDDPVLRKIAEALTPSPPVEGNEIPLNEQGKTYSIYGAEDIEEGALNQMNIAVRLPIAVEGALMPDAHQGYGLPIGGVLATENAVIPFGVGVDIGCRMCLSIFDLPENYLYKNEKKLKKDLVENTLFGAGKEFDRPLDHEVLEREEFREIPILKSLHDRAVNQIGSSGSGNHFVEFGLAEILDEKNEFNMMPGRYLAILSHSGSRGLGATVANHYTRIAMERTKLPKAAKHLAWLDLNSEEGNEYWQAMNLAGDYSAACHYQIHQKLAKALGESPEAIIENHHNFAWKEILQGKEVIVHRKGATPAGKNVLGIIPGSMAAPGYIVRGKGAKESLFSASHGAGRKMSKTQAKKSITQKQLKKMLADEGITLIGGGLDEAPIAYKDIEKVMMYQEDLVEVLGKFYPRLVRMDS